MKTILVTGSIGLIGSESVKFFINKGFIDGVNVMMYKDNNEMISKINQLLFDNNLRESIGKFGLELSKQHTYEKRCETLINLYNKL